MITKFKLYENIFLDLHFTINVNELKEKGYIFQKLYAANYKTYRKKIECHTILVWEKDKLIEIDDWYSNTKNILDFYTNNFESWSIKNNKLPKPMTGMKIRYNIETGDIKMYDFVEYYTMLNSVLKSDIELIKYHEKYNDWREINLIPNCIDPIIEEIKYLTK